MHWNSNKPHSVLKAVFSWSAAAIGICQCPLVVSNMEIKWAWLSFSNISSMLGIRNTSNFATIFYTQTQGSVFLRHNDCTTDFWTSELSLCLVFSPAQTYLPHGADGIFTSRPLIIHTLRTWLSNVLSLCLPQVRHRTPPGIPLSVPRVDILGLGRDASQRLALLGTPPPPGTVLALPG